MLSLFYLLCGSHHRRAPLRAFLVAAFSAAFLACPLFLAGCQSEPSYPSSEGGVAERRPLTSRYAQAQPLGAERNTGNAVSTRRDANRGTVNSEASRPMELVVSAHIDLTLSMGKSKRLESLRALNLVLDALPRKKRVAAYGFTEGAPAVIFRARPSSSEDVESIEQFLAKVSIPSKTSRAGAVFADMRAQLADAGGQAHHVFVVVTDGELTDFPAIRAECEKIAALPGLVAVVVLPVSPDNDFGARAKVEAALAPLGERAIVANRFDAEPAVREMKRLVRAAQEGGK